MPPSDSFHTEKGRASGSRRRALRALDEGVRGAGREPQLDRAALLQADDGGAGPNVRTGGVSARVRELNLVRTRTRDDADAAIGIFDPEGRLRGIARDNLDQLGIVPRGELPRRWRCAPRGARRLIDHRCRDARRPPARRSPPPGLGLETGMPSQAPSGAPGEFGPRS